MSKKKVFSYILIIIGLMAYLNYESEENVGIFKPSKRKIASVNHQKTSPIEIVNIHEEKKEVLDIEKKQEELSSSELNVSKTEPVEFDPREQIYKNRLVFGIPKGPAACLSDYDSNGCILHAYHCIEIIREKVELDEASDFINPEILKEHALSNLELEYYYEDRDSNVNYLRELDFIKNEKASYWKTRNEEYGLKNIQISLSKTK
jgi:hypothetical protein